MITEIKKENSASFRSSWTQSNLSLDKCTYLEVDFNLSLRPSSASENFHTISLNMEGGWYWRMFGRIVSRVLRVVAVVLVLTGAYDFLAWFRNSDPTMTHLRIATVVWILMGIVVYIFGHALGRITISGRSSMIRLMQVAGIIVLLLIAGLIYHMSPRNISLSVKGDEYRLGSAQIVKPVTLQVTGTLQTSLLGVRTFNGLIDIHGVPVSNVVGHGMTVQMFSNAMLGGIITYVDSKTQQVNQFGELFSNRQFNEFTITVFQADKHGFGWSGANGLMISAPAQNRTQALHISNHLLESQFLHGHPLS